MQSLGAGRVELAMHNARAGGHALDLIRSERLLMAHAVLMRQRTLGDVGEDFHIAMGVHAEALAGSHAVFIDHTQAAETHELGVVIAGERKRMITIEPAMIGVASFFTFANLYHFLISLSLAKPQTGPVS